tara:strand:+ start:213 stop:767 length:555 start_codon:yes stop_codon:yes gene_type:complete
MTDSPNTGGLMLTTDKLPLPPTAEEILRLLRHVLSKQFVQDIRIQSNGMMTVKWYRAPSDTIHDKDPDVSPDTVLDRAELSNSDHAGSPKERVADCLLELELEGLVPTNLFCNSLADLKGWLGYTRMFRFPVFDGDPMFLGLRILETPNLPKDALVVCASPIGDASLNYITKGIRLLMENADDR